MWAHSGSKCLKDREYQQCGYGIKNIQALQRSQPNLVTAKISNSAVISERNRDAPRDSSNPGGGCTAMRETDAYWFDQFIFIPVDPSSWNSLSTMILLLTSTFNKKE
ncbi:hypothetical protein J6590_070301 [Homalodisca vitripennis]|nr:hypothetical protein J6590_070301 [Homalodisca vitripennis]